MWHSSLIVKRVSKTTLSTRSGSLYQVSDSVDMESMEEQGFSSSFTKIIQNGFPPNLMELLGKELYSRERDNLNDYPVPLAQNATISSEVEQNITQTRSGRAIKRPSAFWANERGSIPSSPSLCLKRKWGNNVEL